MTLSTLTATLLAPPVIMAGVACLCAVGGLVILTRRTTGEQGVYAKRIAGTMALAMALILAIFAWGLNEMAGL